MRIKNCAATIIAIGIMILCSGTAHAFEVTKGSVAFNYWMADFTESGEETNQNFLPYFTAAIYFDGINAALIEFSDSDSETDSSGYTKSSQRYLVGYRHDFDGGGHVTVAWHDTEIKYAKGGVSAMADLNGLRIGGGADLKIFDTPWTFMLDLGLGLSNNIDVFGLGGLNADVLEITTGMKYNFDNPGFTGRVGYRYLAVNQSGGTINGVNYEEETYKYDGLFFGIGYDF